MELNGTVINPPIEVVLMNNPALFSLKYGMNAFGWMRLVRFTSLDRTLGTGVSPYNGLANGSFSPPSLVFKGLQSEPMPLSRTQGLSFGCYCAPFCAPLLIQRQRNQADSFCASVNRPGRRANLNFLQPFFTNQIPTKNQPRICAPDGDIEVWLIASQTCRRRYHDG